MLKATVAAALLFCTSLPTAFADIGKINEVTLIKAIGSPVLKKVQEEDAPGCMTTRYTFGDKIFDMKLELKCDRINVAWTGSDNPQYEARSKQAVQLAQRAVGGLKEQVQRLM